MAKSIRLQPVPNDRTLVLFPGALGDFLCLWPALQALREETGAPITLAIKADLFDLMPEGTCHPVSIDARQVGDLFAAGSLDASTRRLFAGHAVAHSFLGAGDERLAHRLREATGGRVAVHRVRGMEPGEHASHYFGRCLGVTIRARRLVPADAALRWAENFWNELALGDRCLVLHAGSGGAPKNWLGMAESATRWRARPGARVLLLTGPAEPDGDVPCHDARVREASLSRVAALLRRARCYLGNDSGISHLAGLVGAPGAVAFGPTDPATWRPAGSTLSVVQGREHCAECGPAVFCTHRLAVDEVWRALAESVGVGAA